MSLQSLKAQTQKLSDFMKLQPVKLSITQSNILYQSHKSAWIKSNNHCNVKSPLSMPIKTFTFQLSTKVKKLTSLERFATHSFGTISSISWLRFQIQNWSLTSIPMSSTLTLICWKWPLHQRSIQNLEDCHKFLTTQILWSMLGEKMEESFRLASVHIQRYCSTFVRRVNSTKDSNFVDLSSSRLCGHA